MVHKSSWPWSRRQLKWDPPTPLDRMLSSPLLYLVSLIYSILLSLRGPPFKSPRNKPSIRIVCISDTHSNTLPIPPGDVLIHAGDMTNSGLAADIQAQIDWIASQLHREKIIIAGNHDNFFDPKSRRQEDRNKQLNFKGVRYLVNKSVVLKFKGGRKLNFNGCPGIPRIGSHSAHAFQYESTDSYWTTRIPPQTDVLITHTPPAHHLDISLGCPALLSAIWASKPRLHIFGHVHSGHGREAVYWDPGQAAYERLCASLGDTGLLGWLWNAREWLDVGRVVFYGVRGILWDRLMVGKAGGNGSLLVNAAVVWGSTTDVGHKAIVVDI
ncbi:Metallo-dependent phosphatase-like protein [Calycina marina]|uniref:Metallo-dependent phosphatase-like protein n=1 Tax=Calycina marina TaxID=1763456 RepID=A0A9P8CF72_9HELO|nr:Metallo-dependent phosphatase-like protein [Calycina marina]